MFLFWTLTAAIIAGQLIKLPLFSGGGVTILDLATALLCFVGLVKLKFKLKKPPLFIISALLFILIAILSLMMTPLHLTGEEYLISFLYTVRFFGYIFLGWIVFSGLQNNTRKALLVSGVTLAVLGLLQFIYLPDLQFLSKFGWDPHYFRTVSTFLDPNFLGAFLVLTLLLIKQKPSFIFIIVYLALLTTFSRSSYLAFLVSFLTLSISQKSLKLGICTLLLFLLMMLGFFTYQKAVAEPKGVNRTESASFRMNTWQQGWQVFAKHPIFGVGFNAYKFALKEYNLADSQFLKSHGATSNDSGLLYIASTTGILGFTIYLFFLFSLIKKGDITLTSAVLGLLAQSFFVNNLFYPPILAWLVLIQVAHYTKS